MYETFIYFGCPQIYFIADFLNASHLGLEVTVTIGFRDSN